LDAGVGCDGVSADTVESTVTLSTDDELPESTSSVAAESFFKSAAAFAGELDGVDVSVVGTSRSLAV